MRRRFDARATLARAILAASLAAAPAAAEPARYGYEVVNVYPHDPAAFTQGLLVADGDFYESTGIRGRSSVRRVDIETGDILKIEPLPDRYFGEGLALVGDRLVALTYQEETAFVLSRDGFRRVGQFAYEGEGWGLAYDGALLVMSDGSSRLEFRDPETFEVVRAVDVTLEGRPLRNINELEIVGDRILANVYGADQIVRIDPKTGVIDAIVDLTGIIAPEERGGEPGDPPPVLNGIAYDPATERLFVTGKLWPKVFEIRIFQSAP